MWPPLFKVLLNEPTLLARHVAAYAALVKQDAHVLYVHQTRRIGYLLVLVGGVMSSLLFAGIALMLHAVTGSVHWLLWAVPAVPLAGAFAMGWCLWRTPVSGSFPHTRAQLHQDIQLFDTQEPRS
tara:strand:- start:204 stop:578 length:375 start_codon:yes stop_codon:yes gene_type:complete